MMNDQNLVEQRTKVVCRETAFHQISHGEMYIFSRLVDEGRDMRFV